MFPISRRRRNILLACGAVAAGGYVTYRIYHSRKRLRVFLFFESFSTLLEVLAQSSNTFSVVLNDLHSFLVSEEDAVPLTVRQLLKVGRSPEAQESVAALSAAVSRGILSTLISSGSIAPSLHNGKEQPRRLQSRISSPKRAPGFFEETKNVIKWGDRDTKASLGGASTFLDDRALSPDDDENVAECDGVLDVDAWTNAGCAMGGVKAQIDSSIARGMKEALQEGFGDDAGMQAGKRNGKELLLDSLAEKLFSESGKGFASAMVASASRSFVLSVLEHSNTPNRGDGAESGGKFLRGLFAFAHSTDGRAVLTNWIEIFVGTAVSVYLDRTKDINMFDELAASLGKPEHQGPITDLLTTICEASASSFVRTSHEVLTSDPDVSKVVPEATISSSSDLGELFQDSDEDSDVFYDIGEQEPLSPTHFPVKWKGKAIVGKKEPLQSNYIEHISKVIAVPSNRKLILDIARTMTSSAVQSTIDVSLAKVSAAFSGKGLEPVSNRLCSEAPKRSGVGEKLQAVGDATKAVVDKSVVLMTMCFAVCLHSVMGGVRLIQPY